MISYRRRQMTAAGLLGIVQALPAMERTAREAIRLDERPAFPRATFPLSVWPGRRYLVDAAGAPFLIHGDAAWSLIARLTREQAGDYLSDRQRRGFNAVLVNLIEHEFADAPPRNRYGIAPFLRAGDFSQPDERYFAYADEVIGKAGENGILVLLAPAYLGFGGGSEGWYKEMQANGEGRIKAYGHYVARRLGRHANLLWVMGGDFNPPDKSLLGALVTGIREVLPKALLTFHGARGTSATDFLGTGESWFQISNIYTDSHNVVEKASAEFGRTAKPFFLIEGRYEWAEGIDARVVRLQAWQAVLSGACGQIMGNWAIWQFGNGWERALGGEASATMETLRMVLESLPWTRLLPDRRATLLTRGAGAGMARAVAAVTDDGHLGLVYMPSSREIRIEARALSGGSIQAHWIDPTHGRRQLAEPKTSGAQLWFDPPGRNAGRDGDWLLLLESAK